MATQTSQLTDHLDSAHLLEWTSRQLARGLQLGSHRSKQVGVGMEFHQFRNYVQGDDVRLLDWKMYAKTQDYFIRQADIESTQQLHIHIDTTRSMDYQEADQTKIDLAKLITATLTYVMARQGDQFSWSAAHTSFADSYGLHNWRRSVLELDKLTTHNNPTTPSTFVNNGLLLWITDLYEDLDIIKKFILEQHQPFTEVIIFHLVGRKEENLSFDANTKFVDLETQQEIQVNAKQYAATYKEALGQHIHEVKQYSLQQGVVYQKIYLQDNIQEALQLFLLTYNRLAHS